MSIGKKIFITLWLSSTILLFIIPFNAYGQSETVEIEPDQYTVVLDHFNGSCKENCRYIGYVNSLPGLDRAANFTGNAYSIYQIPWHLCGPINGQGTIEMWIRLRHYDMRLVSGHSNYNAGPTYMVLYVRKDGRLGYYVWPTGTTPLVSDSPIPLLEWNHIAVTWEPEGTKIYINGNLDAEIATNFSQRTCTYMGHHYHVGKGRPDIGLIDEFHVSYTQRNADEIARHGTYRDVVPRLALGVPVSDQVPGGQSRLYKVTTQPDKDLLVTLEQTGTPAADLAFYSRRDNFPSPLRYDSYNPRQTGQARQTFIFPAAFQPQTYYFLIRSTAPPSDSTGFTILARHPALYVEEVSPASAGNAGSVTLSIKGCQFSDDMGVTLIAPSGESLTGASPVRFDGTTLYAAFDLTGKTIGKYDVKVVKPYVDPIILTDALDVIPGIGPRLKVRLKAPTIIRSQRPFTMWVEYENSGDADSVAPLFRLNHSPGSEIQIGGSKRKSVQELYLMGVSTSGPAGVIPPGSRHRIPITFTSLSGDAVQFKIEKYLPDGTPVQWDDIKTALRPPLLDDSEWTDYWNRAISSAGETWQEVIDGLPPGIGGTSTKLEYSADFTSLLQYTLGLNELAAQEASSSTYSREPALMRSTNPTPTVDVFWVNGFDPGYNCTYIVTHGWRSSYRDMAPLADKIKKHCPECNIAIVNWEVPASGPIYNPWGVAGNIPAVAKAVYDNLKKEVGDYNFSNMTYVGHSFGNALNKNIAGYERTNDGKTRGKMVALDPPNPLGGGKHGQPDFAGSFEKESSSYSTASFLDAKPCVGGRIADKQYYLRHHSHGGALDCLEKVLENASETDCANDWLNGSQSIPPAGDSFFDGYSDCDGNHYPNPIDPCPEYYEPPVPWKPGPSTTSYVFRAADPNEKVGILGSGEPDYFIRPGTEITYTVYFENKPSATAPAQEVFINDQLDSDLDWSSLRLGEIAFGDRVITALCGKSSGFTSVMQDGYRVDIEVLFDPDSGNLNWTFRTLDPVTGLWPEDPLAGFLPPNDPETGSGEGHVTFTVRCRADLADGTEVTNMAGIVFDTEPRIDTNTWKNVINSQIVVNHPPKAEAGDDVTVTSEKLAGTVIQGTAEDEDDDDALEYCWKEGDTLIQAFAPVNENRACPLDCSSLSLTLGSHTLTLEVTDGTDTAADDMVLTVENSPPRAAAEGSGEYEINTPVTLRGTVSDFDGDALNYRWLEGGNVFADGTVRTKTGGASVAIPDLSLSDLGLGTHTIVLLVTDKENDPVTVEVNIKVVDTTPPNLSPAADPTSLWPPNHKLKKIYIKTNVSDNSGLPVVLTAAVSSSEPENGLGDGDRAPDWTEPVINQTDGIIKLKLRAERSGRGTGRVYTVTITATDQAGNSSRATVSITVPHDIGKRKRGK